MRMTNQPDLSGMKLAILAANGFKERDMSVSQKALNAAGANVRVISVDQNLIMGWADGDWGHHYAVDYTLSRALSADYDGLVVPGGVRSLEKLELTQHTKRFIKGFFEAKKPSVFLGDSDRLLDFSGLDKSDRSAVLYDGEGQEDTDIANVLLKHFGSLSNHDVLAA